MYSGMKWCHASRYGAKLACVSWTSLSKHMNSSAESVLSVFPISIAVLCLFAAYLLSLVPQYLSS